MAERYEGRRPVRAAAWAQQADLDALREEVNDLSQVMDEESDARFTVIERALASVITDVEGLVAYLTTEGPEPSDTEAYMGTKDGGPDDLYYGTGDVGGSDDLRVEPRPEESPAEEAARLWHEAIEHVERENESAENPTTRDFNDVVDVPEDGITIAPGSDEPDMGAQ